MASPNCFSNQAQLPFKARISGHGPRLPGRTVGIERFMIPHSRQVEGIGANIRGDWSNYGKLTTFMRPNLARDIECRRISSVSASCLPSTQIASCVFTLGTAAVLPFYTLMVVAPKAELTNKVMQSSLPYIALGLLYGYLLYLSWTPDTIRLMFSGNNLLPELPAIAKLFSSEMTLASAWIHLLAVDLFAARQVFHDGQQENVETRHSVSLCLLFCPIGVLTHFLTKAITKSTQQGFQ